MKTAREIVHEAFVSAVHAGLWAKAIPGCCDPGVTADLHGTDCDMLTAAIEQARREAFEAGVLKGWGMEPGEMDAGDRKDLDDCLARAGLKP